MVKKAYVKTEIYKWLNEKRREGQVINEAFIVSSYQDLYKMLEENPEQPLGGCPYDQFVHWAEQGRMKAKMFQGSGFVF